jgi:hypothetical protein
MAVWSMTAAYEKAIRASATGGTVTNIAGYRVHTFDTVGTFNFTVTSGGAFEYLVIGGGGGGGGYLCAGGGGAGGYRCSVPGESSGGGASAESPLILPVGTYTVTVGAGAPLAATYYPDPGRTGSDSVFHTITSKGGGGGGTYNYGT